MACFDLTALNETFENGNQKESCTTPGCPNLIYQNGYQGKRTKCKQCVGDKQRATATLNRTLRDVTWMGFKMRVLIPEIEEICQPKI